MKKFGFLLFLAQVCLQTAWPQCELTISPSNPGEACNLAIENVVWTDLVNLSATGNSLTKTAGGNNWNAGAASTALVYDFGYFEFRTDQNNRAKMIGLDNSNPDANFNSIDYAWFLRDNGTLRIYQNGSNIGDFGTYAAGDTFRIALDNGEVKYFQNGVLKYVSNVSPSLPLLVDCSINDVGGTVNDAKIANGFDGDLSFSVAAPGAGTGPVYGWRLNGITVSTGATYSNTALIPGDSIRLILSPGAGGCSGVNDTSNYIVIGSLDNLGDISDFYIAPESATPSCLEADVRIVWTDIVNAEANGNDLNKIQGGNNWNAGASSLLPIQNGNIFFFVAQETNRDRMIGLSNTDTDADFNTIEFAWYLRDNGTLRIYENGSNIGDFGSYNSGDTFSIEISNNEIFYKQNGILRYISGNTPVLPLIADVSINDEGGTVGGAFVRIPKTGTFNAFANNAGSGPTYQWYLNSIPVGTNADSYSEDSIEGGDFIYCDITPDLAFCSGRTFRSDTIFVRTRESTNLDTFYIENTASVSACQEAREIITWTDLVNLEATGNNLEKIQGGNGNWNAGAASLNKVFNNGYFQFVATETDRDRMVGLSNVNSDANFSSIEYAWFLRSNGQLRIYENGNNRGDFGAYNSGDVFEVRVENNVVKYFRNGTLDYISANTPTSPLIADVSFEDEGASISNAIAVNGNTGSFFVISSDPGPNPSYQWFLNGAEVGSNAPVYSNPTLSDNDSIFCTIFPDITGCKTSVDSSGYESQPIIIADIPIATFGTFYSRNDPSASACQEARELITWVNLENNEATGNSLEKIQGGNGNWNGGAMSLNEVFNNGRFEFVATETDRDRMAGLSDTSLNSNFNTIQYAWFLRSNGQLRIYENGNNRGDFGAYSAGDTFGVHVENGEVKYFRNGVLEYISGVAPSLPLVADVSIEDEGGTVTNASVVNGNTGIFTTIAENAGLTPTYTWFLNGVIVGTNDSVYVNTNLSNGDTLFCNVIPNLGGCGAGNSYNTEPIIIQDIPSASFGTFFTGHNGVESACTELIEFVTWVDLQNLEATSNSLNKIQGGNGNWNGGAASLNTVVNNGRLEFTASETNRDRMVGLSNNNPDANFTSIEYAWQLRSNGQLRIRENGAFRGDFGPYTSGDTFGVHVEAGVVKYYQNGTLRYISAVSPVFPLIADVSIQDEGGTVTNALIINGNVGNFVTIAENAGASASYEWFINGVSVGNNDSLYTNTGLSDGDTITVNVIPAIGGCSSTNSYTTQPVVISQIDDPTFGVFYAQNEAATTSCQEAIESITWTDIVNLEAVGNNLEKIQGGSNNWNAGAASFNQVFDNGRLQFEAGETNEDRAIGLSFDNPSANLNTIDYAWNLRSNGQLRIYENGALRGDFGPYASGDTFSIRVDNGSVGYYQNGTLIYLSTVAPTLPLIADVSINDEGGTVTHALIINGNTGTFTVRADSSGSNPTYEWFLNGISTGISDTVYTNTTLLEGDQIYCSIIPALGGCSPATAYQTAAIEIRNVEDLNFGNSVSQNDIADISPLVAYEEVVWVNASNLETSGNDLLKIQSNNNWDGGASSLNRVSDNSMLQMVVAETNEDRMFGLSEVDVNSDFTTIEYAVYLRSNGNLTIYENGINRGGFGTYSTLDTIKIVHFNGVIEYYRNQNLLYTSAIAPADTLIADVSIQDIGGTITEAMVVHYTEGEFSTSVSGFGPDPNYQWLLNGSNVGTNSPAYSNASLMNGDVVECRVFPDTGGCDANNAFVANRIFITDEIYPLPLPLELLYFEYELTDSGVLLKWETLREVNGKSFDLQRSEDAVDFVTVKTVDAQGDEFSGSRYSVLDEELISGTVYYRLKQNDKDGRIYFSSILAVNHDMQNELNLSLFPNPSNGIVTIFGLSTLEKYRLEVRDIRGLLVRAAQRKDHESIEIDLQDVEKGIYIVNVFHESGVEKLKVIIQ